MENDHNVGQSTKVHSQVSTYWQLATDRSSIAQPLLNIDGKIRSNPLPWRGQFSPQFVQAILDAYARPSDTILDPFVGSGTLLLEAARKGVRALGAEVNPAGAILARLYSLCTESQSCRSRELRLAGQALAELSIGFGPSALFGNTASPPSRDDILQFVYKTSRIQRVIRSALVLLAAYHERELDAMSIIAKFQDLSKFIRELPRTSNAIDIFLTDARALPIPDQSVDLVVTSPPYINVFNYHQQHRVAAEFLGWRPLAAAPSEFGSNRKNRKNRFLTVIQFALDISQTLAELCRVVKVGRRMVFVVGRESSVGKTPFLNGVLVADLASRGLGVPLERRQERVFTNRYGQRIYEDILHFTARTLDPGDFLPTARRIAAEFLIDAIPISPPDRRAWIADAISAADEVCPSPHFVRQAVYDGPGGPE